MPERVGRPGGRCDEQEPEDRREGDRPQTRHVERGERDGPGDPADHEQRHEPAELPGVVVQHDDLRHHARDDRQRCEHRGHQAAPRELRGAGSDQRGGERGGTWLALRQDRIE